MSLPEPVRAPRAGRGLGVRSVDVSYATLQALSPVRAGLARTACWVVLCIAEIVTISWLYEVPASYAPGDNPLMPVRHVVVWALVAAGAFALVMWPRPMELLEAWQREQARHDFPSALLANLALFAALAGASAWLTATLAAAPDRAHTTSFIAYAALLAATAVSLLRVDISLASALRLVRQFRTEILIAAAASAAVQGFGLLANATWEPMAKATLVVAKALLELYEPVVIIDEARRAIRVGDFGVLISDGCSGYEGIALVTAFVSIYLWVFRETLHFPRAFLLYPIAIPAIWLLNSVRIAALTSLGAHVSPHIAVQGFHSQAGWIAFLLATLGIMALAQRWRYLQRSTGTVAVAAPAHSPARAQERGLLAHLVPFMALMAASIVIAAAAPYDRHLYGLKLLAVGIALWVFRDVYAGWRRRVSAESVLAGLLVGALWIATDPTPGAGTLGPWLESLAPGLALAWLVARVAGTVIAVPIAEELAFRGFLVRWITDRNFERVPYGRLAVLGILVSSVLFGVMHERWLAGTLAGVAFALVMYRSRSIAAPIAAHMAANALIAAWAIAFRQWSLL